MKGYASDNHLEKGPPATDSSSHSTACHVFVTSLVSDFCAVTPRGIVNGVPVGELIYPYPTLPIPSLRCAWPSECSFVDLSICCRPPLVKTLVRRGGVSCVYGTKRRLSGAKLCPCVSQLPFHWGLRLIVHCLPRPVVSDTQKKKKRKEDSCYVRAPTFSWPLKHLLLIPMHCKNIMQSIWRKENPFLSHCSYALWAYSLFSQVRSGGQSKPAVMFYSLPMFDWKINVTSPVLLWPKYHGIN